MIYFKTYYEKIEFSIYNKYQQLKMSENNNNKYFIPKRCLRAIIIGAISGATVIGLSTILLPVIGFGVFGPIAGSFAAWVQSIIGAEVSSGSIFALLQSIGMAGFSFSTGLMVTGTSAGLAYSICKALGYENDIC